MKEKNYYEDVIKVICLIVSNTIKKRAKSENDKYTFQF